MASSRKVPHPAIAPSRPKTPTFTIGARIWSAITSVDSVRTILTQPEPQATNASLLWLYSSEIELISAGSSTKRRLKATMPSSLLGTNSRLSFGKVSENPSYLWLTSWPRSSEISNTSRRRYKIWPLTCNILNLFW